MSTLSEPDLLNVIYDLDQDIQRTNSRLAYVRSKEDETEVKKMEAQINQLRAARDNFKSQKSTLSGQGKIAKTLVSTKWSRSGRVLPKSTHGL